MKDTTGMAYIGRKPCGCVCAAYADEPEIKDDIAKEIAKWIKQGLTVERVTDQYVRDNLTFNCPHKAQSSQLSFFEDTP